MEEQDDTPVVGMQVSDFDELDAFVYKNTDMHNIDMFGMWVCCH